MGGLSHTVSGDIASFRTPSRVPIESLKFHFLPKQAAGTPSPENPIPIEGWTGLNGTRTHKNMLKVYKYSAQNSETLTNPKLTNDYGTTINTTDGTAQELVVTQSQHPHSTASNYQNGYISIWSKTLEFGNYYDISMKVNVTDNPLNVSLGSFVLLAPQGNTKYPTVKGNILIFKNVLYSPYVRDGVQILTRKTLELRICGMSMKISEIMATPAYKSDGVYEPYSEELIPITFPDGQTIYGGYIDPVRGKIVATYAMYGLAWKDWNFEANLGNNTRKIFSINYSPYNYPKFDSGVIKTTASRCNVTNYYYNNNSDDIPHYYINSTGRTLYAILPNDMDENTVVQISSILAEPIEYDIDPISIKAFLDYNNFWSDANDITEVTYPITESKDILATRKKAIDFNIGHHKKVKWNNMAGEMSDQYWQRYNENAISVTYENGEAVVTISNIMPQRYTVSIYTKNDPYVYSDHYYYMSFMVNPDYDDAWFGAEYAKDVYLEFSSAPKNTWTRCSARSKANGTGTGRIYIPYFRQNTYQVGDSARIKNVYYVDLTLMFGAGNEPTKEEFERICAINGIDLTTYHQYDTGSDRWLIIP